MREANFENILIKKKQSEMTFDLNEFGKREERRGRGKWHSERLSEMLASTQL